MDYSQKVAEQTPVIGVLGLGYVGLPLAIELGKKYQTAGFDISEKRISELKAGRDSTLEVDAEDFSSAQHLTFTCDKADLKQCNTFIVTVPTPIDDFKTPDLRPLLSASKLVGEVMSEGATVIFESTVYPGATELVCVPEIERVSGLKFNETFFAGYSPERINPGDKEHRLPTIMKVTSGSTPEIAEYVDNLYASIITAGTHKASSIAVAEAAKVIENTQRDVNIALVNELAMIFHKLGIDTEEVLAAAGTKWNFLPFKPGLVGGHCIGVDPYYLTHRSQQMDYHPEMILAGRRINDGMGSYVADRTIQLMTRLRMNPVGARILVCGLAFKENCPDLRNTKVVDVVKSLRAYHLEVDIYDPWVDPDEAEHEYGLRPINEIEPNAYDGAILAVAHREFINGTFDLAQYLKPDHFVFDIKGVLPKDLVDERL